MIRNIKNYVHLLFSFSKRGLEKKMSCVPTTVLDENSDDIYSGWLIIVYIFCSFVALLFPPVL